LVPLTNTEDRKKIKKHEIEDDTLDEIELSKEEKVKISSLKPLAREKSSEKPLKRFKKLFIFLGILACIVMIGFALSLIYSKAIVTITSEKLSLNIDGKFIAKKDINNTDLLGYQVITITDEFHKKIPAVDGALVQTKAKGTVILYNSYSTTTQKIVAGSRLSSSNGLIYKTLTSVTIPGKKTIQGKVTPGAISVVVIADQYGEQYNAKVSTGDTYKFIGYKGTSKYDTFSAKLKTDIIGGYSGKKKTISPELAKSTMVEVENTLKTMLLNKIKTIIPSGFVMFDNAYNIEYLQTSTSTAQDNTADIGSKGTLYAVVFNTKSLINYIAKKEIQTSGLIDYKIEGLESLKFTIINTKDFSAKKGTALSFTLTGPANVIGIIKEDTLKNKLLGLKLKEVDSVIKDDPSIKYVKVLLTPFWMRSFPNSSDNITIDYK
jgi:hypothetical protein